MTVKNIRPREAYQRMQEGYAYLDVRTVEEFKEGHSKGSVNIPIFIKTPAGRELNPNFLALVAEQFSKTTKLVIGCHSGGRSAKACELLGTQGYTDLYNIDGGFKEWSDENLPKE